jgi:hypothetical protein
MFRSNDPARHVWFSDDSGDYGRLCMFDNMYSTTSNINWNCQKLAAEQPLTGQAV